MTYETEIKTLKQFVKWANRKGAKYPLPGCPVNYDDITNASKTACAIMQSAMSTSCLTALIEFAKQGARSLSLNPDKIPSIREADKIAKRLQKCQDTESQPTIQHA